MPGSASGAALQRREQDRLTVPQGGVAVAGPALPKPWQRLLHQRGAVLDRAICRLTDAVVCRLRLPIPLHPTT